MRSFRAFWNRWLRECGEAYVQRFGIHKADLYHVLRALTYFDDAEKNPVMPAGLEQDEWAKIKAFFRAEAPKRVVPRAP